MLYKVMKNGKVVITSVFFKDASKRYEECIYDGKPGDFISLYYKKTIADNWQLARKDWI